MVAVAGAYTVSMESRWKTLFRVAVLLLLPPHAAVFGEVVDEVAPRYSVVLPAVASLHGLPPAFFHSDVAIFNRSAGRAALVRAKYRCTTSSCGSSSQIFAIAPRQLYVLEDIVAGLFAAPETSGAIEFTSTEPIVVTSRLYSPARPAPTLGMFVPGLGPEGAFVRSQLVNLSHSHDPSVGFRTNVGVFNPSDENRTVFIVCRDFRAALLGSTVQVVGPHQLFQINDGDLFREFSVLRSVPAFYCSVDTDNSFVPLYAWAAVIDNQSNDTTFVTGQRFFAPARPQTVPAAASLHGAAGTFFHSDLAILNDDVLGIAQVNVRYRCSLGSCAADPEKTFLIGPAGMQVFGDVVESLFGLPESGGSIELTPVCDPPAGNCGNHITVASRLYTADAVRGTVGMSVPALDSAAATPRQVLPLLSKGSRVNVGVLNAETAPQLVTIRLFSGSGQLLGTLSRLLGARDGTQVNDVFGALGITEEPGAAYCTVQGDGTSRVWSYAAIIDNLSQDPILVAGQDDPEAPPPIE
jgi:hypothetical protein